MVPKYFWVGPRTERGWTRQKLGRKSGGEGGRQRPMILKGYKPKREKIPWIITVLHAPRTGSAGLSLRLRDGCGSSES
jgi:hypothetical protein